MSRSIVSLLLAVLLLEIGSGLQGVLIPVRSEFAGFPTWAIGILGTCYHVGFVGGCLLLPNTVRRVGHIRCFSALAAIAASLVLVHALIVEPLSWMIIRMAVGFCFAGLFMVAESWLNDQATERTRGHVLGLYTIATWIGVIGGKLLFSVAEPTAFDLFAMAAIAIGLSLVPIALTNGAVPTIPQPSRIGLGELYRTAPTGLVGCIAIGLANGAFWTFAPLFAQARLGPSLGVSLGVSLFMAACVIGSAVIQWPIGRASDRVDRRWVILALCAASTATGLLLAWAPVHSAAGLLGLAILFGASSLSIYAICVAHANDRADASAFVEISSYLLLAFGIGAIFGPFLAGLIIAQAGITSLFVFTATIEAVFVVFVLIRIHTVEPVPEPERAIFGAQPPLTHGTQAMIDLQPIAGPNTEEQPR